MKRDIGIRRGLSPIVVAIVVQSQIRNWFVKVLTYLGRFKSFKEVLLIISVSVCSVVHAEQIVEQRKILPYIEAEGEVPTFPNYSLAWVAPEKIVYSTFSNPNNYSLERLEGKTIEYFDAGRQVVLFNLTTKKTEFHQKGHLLRYKDDLLTILLKRIHYDPASLSESYDELLEGPFGAELPVTYYQSKQPKPEKRCPTDSETNPPKHHYRKPLKPEHGCIREERGTLYDQPHYSYFRAGGQKLDLQIPNKDSLGIPIWIDWLKAYVLGDDVTMEVNNTRDRIPLNTATIKLLTPTGELRLVDMGEYSLNYARPTRAGMIAAKNRSENGALAIRNNGLFLWRDGMQFQITEGKVKQVEVAPDGCKVAYYSVIRNVFSMKNQNSKLRVIDVCEGFGVSVDTNPFK